MKTTGDGCVAAFETAAHAINAAMAAQQAVHAEPWSEIQPDVVRVRMGVHTGEADERAGDYFGPALNRTARLMSIGHGGQVLLSASTAELVRNSLPSSGELQDLGEHRLKDLDRREHVFQLAHPDLPFTIPPLKSIDSFPNNLPTQVTTFIGREKEIGETKYLLSAARLVTLTGSGGTGKTRLSLQVAGELLNSFADGVWWVELAPITEPDLVLQAAAGAMGLRAHPGAPLDQMVTNHLRDKSLLLILDNCEHLVEECARLADHLLRTSPSVKILASSREGLGIAGESTFHVPSLSLPANENAAPQSVAASEAAQLFLDRATAVNSHFSLTPANATAVAQICRRLDGIPLALELAAARVKMLSAEQIAARLDDRFRLLTGGSRTALPRQQTLRAMIDWSYDLLSPEECTLLRALSVFVGGWSLESAEAVCPEVDVLGLLEQLVNKSLVNMSEERGEARFTMLETIRQYARDRLVESGEASKRRDSHLDFFLDLSRRATPEMRGAAALEWLERLDPDIENVRAAAEWGLERRPVDVLEMVGGIFFYWAFRSDDRRQAIHWLQTLLERARKHEGNDSTDRRCHNAQAWCVMCIGQLMLAQGDDHGAVNSMAEVAELVQGETDSFVRAFALGMMANFAVFRGDFATARPLAEESLAIMRRRGETRWLILPVLNLAAIERATGNFDEADRLSGQISSVIGSVDHPMFAPVLLTMGLNARSEGRTEEAKAYFEQGLEFSLRIGATMPFQVSFESELAHLAREKGELTRAKTIYTEVIGKWRSLNQDAAVANILECLAMIARDEGNSKRAACLLGAAEALRERVQVPIWPYERPPFDALVAALHLELTPAELAAAWERGRATDLNRAIAYAIEDART